MKQLSNRNNALNISSNDLKNVIFGSRFTQQLSEPLVAFADNDSFLASTTSSHWGAFSRACWLGLAHTAALEHRRSRTHQQPRVRARVGLGSTGIACTCGRGESLSRCRSLRATWGVMHQLRCCSGLDLICSLQVAGAFRLQVAGAFRLQVAGAFSLRVAGAFRLQVAGAFSLQVAGAFAAQASGHHGGG